MKKILPAEMDASITPEDVFFNRRRFMGKALGMAAIGGASLFCSSAGMPQEASDDDEDHPALKVPFTRDDVFPANRNDQFPLPKDVRGKMTPRLVAATHNNFYEFLPGRGGAVYKHTGAFEVVPWKVEVKGAINNPMTLDLDDIFKFPHEERLYHFRCVERWAMNIPWTGFPLAALIKKADPKNNARYIRFTTAKKPSQMPGMKKAAYYDWPYVEALSIEEAMNPLAMVVTGVYGKPLPIQHGAPLRIIVPWKYGYKNPKSVVKIEFLTKRPDTFWMIQPHEYGFISNVNPYIPHPRWSQSRSYWLGEDRSWFPTKIFNGYETYVKDLYPDEPRTLQAPLRPGQTAR